VKSLSDKEKQTIYIMLDAFIGERKFKVFYKERNPSDARLFCVILIAINYLCQSFSQYHLQNK
jgi:hypothetical protein